MNALSQTHRASFSTSTVLPLRQLGWVVVASLSTLCSANVSLALIYVLCHAAGKSAAALNGRRAERSPNQAAPCLG